MPAVGVQHVHGAAVRILQRIGEAADPAEADPAPEIVDHAAVQGSTHPAQPVGGAVSQRPQGGAPEEGHSVGTHRGKEGQRKGKDPGHPERFRDRRSRKALWVIDDDVGPRRLRGGPAFLVQLTHRRGHDPQRSQGIPGTAQLGHDLLNQAQHRGTGGPMGNGPGTGVRHQVREPVRNSKSDIMARAGKRTGQGGIRLYVPTGSERHDQDMHGTLLQTDSLAVQGRAATPPPTRLSGIPLGMVHLPLRCTSE